MGVQLAVAWSPELASGRFFGRHSMGLHPVVVGIEGDDSDERVRQHQHHGFLVQFSSVSASWNLGCGYGMVHRQLIMGIPFSNRSPASLLSKRFVWTMPSHRAPCSDQRGLAPPVPLDYLRTPPRPAPCPSLVFPRWNDTSAQAYRYKDAEADTTPGHRSPGVKPALPHRPARTLSLFPQPASPSAAPRNPPSP